MSWFNRLTVRVCFLLFFLLAAMFSLFAVFVDRAIQNQEPRVESHLAGIRADITAQETSRSTLDLAMVTTQIITEDLTNKNLAAVEQTLRSVGRDPWIRQVTVFDAQGYRLTEYRAGANNAPDRSLTGTGAISALQRTDVPTYRISEEGRAVSAWAPVWGDDGRLGTLFINRVVREHALTAETLESEVMMIWDDLASRLVDGLTRGATVALVLAGIALVFLSREISRPYQRLEAAFHGLGRGRRVRLKTAEGPAEARRLSDRFNQMADELERVNTQVRNLAFTDSVTSLPNRAAVMERLNTLLALDAEAALLFIDLDDFKRVNDVFGHDVGDETLITVAQRIQNVVRTGSRAENEEGDMVARLGGDEFVVLLTPPPERDVLMSISDRLIESVCQVIEIGNRDIYVGASVGIAIAPDQGSRADTLLRHADMAMYQAKSSGKRTTASFSREMEVDANRMALVESELRGALTRDELYVVYQPIMSEGQVGGYEALVRWDHPELGSVSPGEFIPVAEAYGIIDELDLWIAKTSIISIMKYWERNPTAPKAFLSLNLSGQHFVSDGFVEGFLELVNLSGIDPYYLHVEITETALLRDEHKATHIINRLRDCGIRVFLDDFGTGYSSLSHLSQFSLDGLKIDVSFVKGIPENGESMSVTIGLIGLAHNLGLEVVAEGVEDAVQADFLSVHGCDYLQGYYFGKGVSLPLEADEIVSYQVEQAG